MLMFIIFYKPEKEDTHVISFKKNFMKSNTPIITFKHNNKNFNFILDTGSSVSAIDSKYLHELNHTSLNENIKVVGIEGNPEEVQVCTTQLEYKKDIYNCQLISRNFNGAFGPIERETNLTIHGIIGCDFMRKNNIKIDFKPYFINVNKN